MKNKEVFNEILNFTIQKINDSEYGYYFSWWLRVDFAGKYSTAKINYELNKAISKGLLVCEKFNYGIKYSLPN
jgi:hypothetical protein